MLIYISNWWITYNIHQNSSDIFPESIIDNHKTTQHLTIYNQKSTKHLAIHNQKNIVELSSVITGSDINNKTCRTEDKSILKIHEIYEIFKLYNSFFTYSYEHFFNLHLNNNYHNHNFYNIHNWTKILHTANPYGDQSVLFLFFYFVIGVSSTVWLSREIII